MTDGGAEWEDVKGQVVVMGMHAGVDAAMLLGFSRVGMSVAFLFRYGRCSSTRTRSRTRRR